MLSNCVWQQFFQWVDIFYFNTKLGNFLFDIKYIFYSYLEIWVGSVHLYLDICLNV